MRNVLLYYARESVLVQMSINIHSLLCIAITHSHQYTLANVFTVNPIYYKKNVGIHFSSTVLTNVLEFKIENKIIMRFTNV